MKLNLERIAKTLILEKLGVPDYIIETAENMYQDILDNLLSNEFNYYKGNDVIEMEISGDYRANKIHFDTFYVVLKLHKMDNINDMTLMNMGIHTPTKISNKYMLLHYHENRINLEMEIAMKNTQNEVQDVILFFQNNRDHLIRVLAHEFKHPFDSLVRGKTSPETRTNYSAYSSMSSMLPELQKFFRSLYYVHWVESLTRPTEVASLMKQKNITQKEFESFLLSNDVYVELKEISEFSIDNMINELRANVDLIDDFFDKLNDPDHFDEFRTINQKVSEFLRIIYVTLANIKGQTMMGIVAQNNPLVLITNTLPPEGVAFLRKYYDKISKYEKNAISFYYHEAYKMKDMAKKIMKKLVKLYPLAKSEDELTETKSIYDWNLYQKFHNPNMKFDIHLKRFF